MSTMKPQHDVSSPSDDSHRIRRHLTEAENAWDAIYDELPRGRLKSKLGVWLQAFRRVIREGDAFTERLFIRNGDADER